MRPLWTVPICKGPPSPPGPYRVVCGFDPGSTGACVALSLADTQARAWILKGADVDGFPIADLALVKDAFKVPPVCFMEKVSPEARWGKSSFAFGARAGGMASLLASWGWPLHMVRPQTWQALFHAGHAGDAKAKTMAAYRTLFPENPLPKNAAGRVDHNLVDAMMIALYGAMSLGYAPKKWRFPQ